MTGYYGLLCTGLEGWAADVPGGDAYRACLAPLITTPCDTHTR